MKVTTVTKPPTHVESWPVLPDDSLMIHVTALDLKRGEIHVSEECPLARAIRRSVTNYGPTEVTVTELLIKIGGRYYLDQSSFADRFDVGKVQGPETVILGSV